VKEEEDEDEEDSNDEEEEEENNNDHDNVDEKNICSYCFKNSNKLNFALLFSAILLFCCINNDINN